MKFTAVGDAIIQRRIQADFKGYEELAPFIERGDARFYNLETTLNRPGEAHSSQFSGGTYLRTVPEVIYDLEKFGFNMTTFNNNHAMDFFYDGFMSTLEALEESGIVHAGAGRNLAEASAPRYLETSSGRVALISVNSNFDPSMMAGKQTSRVPGRPGINGLRIEQKVIVTEDEMKFIKDLAKRTNINASQEITIKEGYYPPVPDNQAALGTLKFELGEKSEYVMSINKADIERVERAIYEAKLQADYIIVSVHSHQISGDSKENPSKFLVDFAHHCIDMGANAIVGHGPHLLRPIEVYKDSPIFYSLGDFVLELYNIELAPAEFFEKHGMCEFDTVHDLLKNRSKDFTVGLMEDKRMLETVIPYWETEDGKLTKLELLPVELAMKGNKSEIGLPRRAKDLSLVERLRDMSKSYGVEMKLRDDGIVECSW